MALLYSDVPPLSTLDEGPLISDEIQRLLKRSVKAIFAVGYVSTGSVDVLLETLKDLQLASFNLIIGMYTTTTVESNLTASSNDSNCMSESTFRALTKLDSFLQDHQLGRVRLTKSIKYHGKIYLFEQEDGQLTALNGSANLSVLDTQGLNRRQYESSLETSDNVECRMTEQLLDSMLSERVSEPLSKFKNIPLSRDQNNKLSKFPQARPVPNTFTFLQEHFTTDTNGHPLPSFVIPLKAPSKAERFNNNSYTRSNINVCYSGPTEKELTKSHPRKREWYEAQISVPKSIASKPGFPRSQTKGVPAPWFIAITDDGSMITAHAESGNYWEAPKNFSFKGGDKIMGRWLKGRFVDAGLVKPIPGNEIYKDDPQHLGMITREMMDELHENAILLQKTSCTQYDSDLKKVLDIWLISLTWCDINNKDNE